MKKQLQQQLYDEFPDLCRRHELPPSESNMHSGFLVDDGWYGILHVLCEEIQDIIHRGKLDLNRYCFEQVKEKFGLLRVYMNQWSYDKEISYAIERAVERSEKTCENCGDPGTLRQDHWMRVACDKHQREYLEWYDRGGAQISEDQAQGEAHSGTESFWK